MALILDNVKSNVGSPYVFYTVYGWEVSNTRTVDTVKITVEVESHLQYSSSSLGRGYPLTAYIKLNGTETSIALKSSSDSWSGTTTHTTRQTITVTGLQSSDISLTGITFRVSSVDSGTLYTTSCSNIPITMGHIPPSLNSYTMLEQNNTLISAGITDNVIVDNLSQKQITMTYELHDDATATKFGVYNGITPYLYDTNPFILDFTSVSMSKTDDKIALKYAIRDSLGTQTLSNEELYNNIPYIQISITNNSTTAKRIGQISGRVGLDVSGVLYNGTVGNVDQSAYKPTIKYKYWKAGDTEPSTYGNTIASADITVSDGTFYVSNLDIGSTTESAPNYFDPDYAWRIKVYVEDNFTNAESNELQIQVGEAVWSEYKDRVDFKKLTLQGTDILDIIKDYNVLWGPDYSYMGNNQYAYLNDLVSNQKHGIILVWQAYSSSQPQSYDINYTFIPKFHVSTFNGSGVTCWIANSSGNSVATKYIYVSDDKLQGHSINSTEHTNRSNSTIYTDANAWVLTYVLGI